MILTSAPPSTPIERISTQFLENRSDYSAHTFIELSSESELNETGKLSRRRFKGAALLILSERHFRSRLWISFHFKQVSILKTWKFVVQIKYSMNFTQVSTYAFLSEPATFLMIILIVII